jgi:hypothetical protein
MNHLFVPYKIATGLKEIKFSEDCFAYYQIDEAERTGDPVLCYLPRGKDLKGQSVSEDVRYQKYLKDQHLCATTSFWWKHKFVAVAPTWDQAFEWFRKQYNIKIGIGYKMFNSESSQCYYFTISFLRTMDGENPPVDVWHEIDSYLGLNYPLKTIEETKLLCLQKLIEIVKSKVNQ